MPSGLKVSQNYLVQKSKRIKPFTYLRNSISLTTTIKNSIDKNKQRTAFMPNLVHSLDASTLSLLYFSFHATIASKDQFVNFYSVHDCYGVTAKNAGVLINILRSIYINIYSEKIFLGEFDKNIIDFIKKSYGENCSFDESNRIITVYNIKYKLPKLSPLISYAGDSYEKLSNALYLIN